MNSKAVAAIALPLVLAGCATVPTIPVVAECQDTYGELSARFDREFAEAQGNNWGLLGTQFRDRDGKLKPIDPADTTSPLACAKREWLRKELADVSCELRLEPCQGTQSRVLLPGP